MTTKINYKQVVISELSNGICIFHMSKSNFNDEELHILGIAQFIEYAEYFMPKYVILDRTDVEYDVPDILLEYIKKCGLNILAKIGVRKIFQITSLYSNGQTKPIIRIASIENFCNLDDCIEYIEYNIIKQNI